MNTALACRQACSFSRRRCSCSLSPPPAACATGSSVKQETAESGVQCQRNASVCRACGPSPKQPVVSRAGGSDRQTRPAM